MKLKYSQNLIWKAQEFARTAKEELGEELGEERVSAMFDAFDPGLQRQMFMMMLMGHNGGAMRVKAVKSEGKQKITAIKAIRSVTRFGLKEAKDVIDTADEYVAVIEGNWSNDAYDTLKRELDGTGYELL